MSLLLWTLLFSIESCCFMLIKSYVKFFIMHIIINDINLYLIEYIILISTILRNSTIFIKDSNRLTYIYPTFLYLLLIPNILHPSEK